MTELSPEQIAEIRGRTTRACDRVAVQRLIDDITEISGGLSTAQQAEIGQRVEEAARQLLTEQEPLCDTVDALRAEQQEAGRYDDMLHGELETLRGIAQRIKGGWTPSSGGWWSRYGNISGGLQARGRMTEAEVAAIYGEKENEDG